MATYQIKQQGMLKNQKFPFRNRFFLASHPEKK